MDQNSITLPKVPEPNGKPICSACGTQFPSQEGLSAICPICNDDRQYIPEKGQAYTSLVDLAKKHTVTIGQISEQLYELKMEPDFAIAQRCFLVVSPQGNILWDCIPLLNPAVASFIEAKGGLKAIAFSHPHYYSTMNDWAAYFNCPILIHRDDEPWIMYKGGCIELWDGHIRPMWDGISIIHTGGHFPGSSLLHIPSQSPKGALLCGDTLYIARSMRHIAVMHSYPNQILLTKKEFAAFYQRSAGLEFDTMYGAFPWQTLKGNAKEIFDRAMERYINSYEIDNNG